MKYFNKSFQGYNYFKRILAAFFAIIIPCILLKISIYGSFLFTFSIPILWQVVYLGNPVSSLGLKQKGIVSSIILGSLIGIVLGLIGGRVFQLLQLTDNALIITDSIKIGVGKLSVEFSLARELGYQLLISSGSNIGLILYYLFNIFLIGLGEEIFWRGFIQRKFCTRFKKSVSIIITSILFALMHSYLFVILPIGKGIILLIIIGIVGAIWGFLYEKIDNIWSVALSHGITAAIIWKYFF